jgi:3-hydroxybutyryl-CoA dehydratase
MEGSVPAVRGGKEQCGREERSVYVIGNVLTGNSIEDIPTGLTARFTKTVSESDIYLFAGITGDLDRNHTDEEYCKQSGLGGRVAHGALLVGYMSTASTLIIQGFGRPIVSQGYDHVRFLRPVFIGDTITVTYEIVDVDRARDRTTANVSVHNQRSELVAVAKHIQRVL